MKCVIYVRVSTEKQAEEGTSLDTQVEKCRAYADSEGLRVIKTFREEGESAKVWNRPEFLKTLDYIKKHKIRYLIVYKIDRLSRNTEDQAIIMQSLRDSGAELRSATENIDSTPAGKLMRNLLWSFAHYDNEVRAERSSSGAKAVFHMGYWIHPAPPGYMMVRDPVTKRSMATIVPEQANHIEWAFEKRAEHWILQDIADALNARGFKAKPGRKVRTQTVERIIKNKFYMGYMTSYGEEVKGKHVPIITPELWYRAQTVNDANAHRVPARQVINPLFPLRGLVSCPDCGELLTASSPKGRYKKYEYYHHGSKFCPKSRNIPKAELENKFREELAKLQPKPSMFKLVKAVILDRWKERLQSHTKEQVGIDRQISEVRAEKENLLTEKRRNPNLYTDDDFMSQVQALNSRLSALDLIKADDKAEEDDFEKVMSFAFNALKNPLASWEELVNVKDKLRFQRILYPEGLEYDGNSFGTAKVSLLVSLFEAASTKREKRVEEISSKVTLRRIELRF